MPNIHIEEETSNQELPRAILRNRCMEKYGEDVVTDNHIPYYNETSQSWMCRPFWDTIFCWPFTEANSVASVNCPSYVIGFNMTNYATKNCTANGTWFVNTDNVSWSNYTQCSTGDTITVYKSINDTKFFKNLKINEIDDENENLKAILPKLKIIYQTGYSMTIISLIIAFIIMVSIKKLHCARNILHMNLFAAFIFKAFMHLLKDLIMTDNLGLVKDFVERNGEKFLIMDSETSNYECKLIVSLDLYFILAGYSWILMEGLYLNNLIFRALFVDSSRNLVYYIALGWGLPLIDVICWIIARIFADDSLCWTTINNKVHYIVEVPMLTSVLVNLLLYVNISRILYSKLRSPLNDDCRMYRKWAKSTLVLVPLFGVNYSTLLILRLCGQETKWVMFDRLFDSFIGVFIAVLYCFLNGEVKTELKPRLCNALTFFATNPFFKYCFPCRHKYLSSAVARQSVCTTMSCSSLYTNGVMHRNSKSKWENAFPKTKTTSTEKLPKDHICGSNCQKQRSTSKCSQNGLNFTSFRQQNHQINASVETTLCEQVQEKNAEGRIITSDEEEISMLSKR